MSDEEKYRELRDKLRAVPKVKAKPNFEHKLYSRIRGIESERMAPSVKHLLHTEKERGWLFSLLKPAYIPAIGLTVVVLLALIWFIAYNPVQMNKVQEEVSSKQEPGQQPTSPSISKSQDELKKAEEKSDESPITSADTRLRESAPRTMTRDIMPGPEKTNSDFGIIKTETEQSPAIDQQKIKTVDETIIKAIPKIDAEKKVEDKLEEGVRRIEKKEAPANIRKNEGDLKLKQDEDNKSIDKENENVIKEITPSLKEKVTGKDSKDTVKQKNIKKKKDTKTTEDQNKQEEQKSQDNDSIKKIEK